MHTSECCCQAMDKFLVWAEIGFSPAHEKRKRTMKQHTICLKYDIFLIHFLIVEIIHFGLLPDSYVINPLTSTSTSGSLRVNRSRKSMKNQRLQHFGKFNVFICSIFGIVKLNISPIPIRFPQMILECKTYTAIFT